MSDDTTEETIGLDLEDTQRLIVELLTDGPMDRDDLFAAVALVEDNYIEAMTSYATWSLWRQEQIRFGVVDGEIIIHQLP